MNLAGKTILVIGGAGFIGSHVVAELLKTQVARVVVYDNFSRGRREYLAKSLTDPRCQIVGDGGDVRDVDLLDRAMQGAHGVVHLAAMWLLHCMEYPRTAFSVNVEGTFNVLEEARRAGVKKVVFASTNHTQHGETMGDSPNVLGTSQRVMMRLGDYFNPSSIYGASKATGEIYGRLFARHHGVQFVAMRIGAIGDDDSPARAVGRPSEDYVRAMYLSRRDLVTAFQKALEIDREFTLAYVISNNGRRIFDMRETNEVLGFYPQDDAETFFRAE